MDKRQQGRGREPVVAGFISCTALITHFLYLLQVKVNEIFWFIYSAFFPVPFDFLPYKGTNKIPGKSCFMYNSWEELCKPRKHFTYLGSKFSTEAVSDTVEEPCDRNIAWTFLLLNCWINFSGKNPVASKRNVSYILST